MDRGVLNSPLCIVYGFAGVIIAVTMPDIRESTFFLFLFSALYATVIEWIAGHILERATDTRWWDYSHLPMNLDGYVALPVSVLWGILGVVVVKWGNPLLLDLIRMIPQPAGVIILGVLFVLLAVDAVDTVLTLAGLQNRLPQVEAVGNRMAALTLKMGLWLLGRTERRMVKANPRPALPAPKRQSPRCLPRGAAFTRSSCCFLSAPFWAILPRPSSAASPPVTG